MKKKLSSILSILFVVALVFSLFVINVSADQTYKDVDYSVFLGDYYYANLLSSDPIITETYDGVNNYAWTGSAKGFTNYFHAGINYTLEFDFSANNADFTSFACAVLKNDFTEDSTFVNDLLAVETGSAANGETLTIVLSFTPEEDGYYKILFWGGFEDADENPVFDEDTSCYIWLDSDLSYTDVDYSNVIAPDKTISNFVSQTDAFIADSDWTGYANGYSIYLTQGIEYIFGIDFPSKPAHYDRCLAILKNDLSGDLSSDILVSGEFFSDDNDIFEISFTPEATGWYKFLSWGYTLDENDDFVFGPENAAFELDISASYHGYDTIPYDTELLLGETYEGYINYNSDPLINLYNYNNYARGFSVYLEANTLYYIEATITSLSGAIYNIEGDINVFGNELCGDIYEDILISKDGDVYETDELEITLPVEVAESGYYKVAFGAQITGDSDDVFGEEETAVSLSIREPIYNSYNISTPEDLFALYEDVNDGVADFYTINILDDIDMSGESWTPLNDVFGISINGQNHYITGLSDQLVASCEYFEATDLGIEIDCTASDVYDWGAFVGWASEVNLFNCHSVGELTIQGDDAGTLGGLVGGADTGKIHYSTSTMNINVDVGSSCSYVGGIIGYIYENGYIYYTDYNGNINISISGDSGYCCYVAGIVGLQEYENVIEECIAKGEITISAPEGISAYDVGGIVGYAEDYNDYINTYADVTINAPFFNEVGGFIGYMDEDNCFTNCYSAGKVTGNDCVGGFLGVSNCCGYNNFFNCYTTVDVVGYNYLGGFAGVLYSDEYLYNCFATGSVIGFENAQNVGSFYGYAYDTDSLNFSECYGFDAITNGDMITHEGLYSVDFSDKNAVDEVTARLNANIEALKADEIAEGLLPWSGYDAEGGPTFTIYRDAYPEPPEYPTKMLGDINGNETLDTMDYFLLKRGYFGTYPIEDESVGDINANETFDTMDYFLLKRVYFGTYTID